MPQPNKTPILSIILVGYIYCVGSLVSKAWTVQFTSWSVYLIDHCCLGFGLFSTNIDVLLFVFLKLIKSFNQKLCNIFLVYHLSDMYSYKAYQVYLITHILTSYPSKSWYFYVQPFICTLTYQCDRHWEPYVVHLAWNLNKPGQDKGWNGQPSHV